MPRRKLDKTKNEVIQVAIQLEDKLAFDAWCAAHSTTMSAIVRQEIAPYIAQGKEILAAQNAGQPAENPL